jgi:urease accessory protein
VSTHDPKALLTLLQHGDTFFPSGANAFSWGLETLHADGLLRTAEDIRLLLDGQLKYRWALCDRPALTRAYHHADDLATVASCDAELDSMSLARELREGSRRAGGALLRIHAQLETPQAASYRERIQAGQAYGHLPVVQGMLWRGVGMPLEGAQITSAHALCLGILGAAIRLGIIGHVDAQRILVNSHARIEHLLRYPAVLELSNFAPASEIAMMRHEAGQHRLFVN